jgi:hypothetical protein
MSHTQTARALDLLQTMMTIALVSLAAAPDYQLPSGELYARLGCPGLGDHELLCRLLVTSGLATKSGDMLTGTPKGLELAASYVARVSA